MSPLRSALSKCLLAPLPFTTVPEPTTPPTIYRASKAALNMTLIKFQKREGDKIKMWGGETGWLATDLANTEMMRKVGASHLSIWLEQIASCVKGERDADVGKILDKYGIRMW